MAQSLYINISTIVRHCALRMYSKCKDTPWTVAQCCTESNISRYMHICVCVRVCISLCYLTFHLADGNEAWPPAYFPLGVVFGVSLVHICNTESLMLIRAGRPNSIRHPIEFKFIANCKSVLTAN